MTYSLRESRAETQRQNDDKLAPRAAARPDREARDDRSAGRRDRARGGHAAQRDRGTRTIDPEASRRIPRRSRRTPRSSRSKPRASRASSSGCSTSRAARSARRSARAVNLNELATHDDRAARRAVLAREGQDARRPRARSAARRGRPDRLQQVLINLLLNAVQAMPEGGALVVETSVVRRSRPGLETNADQAFVSVRGLGYRRRHPGRDQGQDLRPVLHDQGRLGRNGPRPRGVLRHRQGARRLDRGRRHRGGGTVFRVYLPA